jgi:uncharacterized protein YbaR (Trm112 family)
MGVIACPSCAKPVVIPDTPTLPRDLDNMCRLFPALCGKVKEQGEQLNAIARSVSKLSVQQDGHVVPSESVIEGWLNCPDCKSKFEALLKGHPELFTPKEKAKKKQFAWER